MTGAQTVSPWPCKREVCVTGTELVQGPTCSTNLELRQALINYTHLAVGDGMGHYGRSSVPGEGGGGRRWAYVCPTRTLAPRRPPPRWPKEILIQSPWYSLPSYAMLWMLRCALVAIASDEAWVRWSCMCMAWGEAHRNLELLLLLLLTSSISSKSDPDTPLYVKDKTELPASEPSQPERTQTHARMAITRLDTAILVSASTLNC